MNSEPTNRLPDPAFWKGKKVLVTGHTGFKGSWLALWLHSMGAEVHGLSLDPPVDPNLFSIANIPNILTSDLRIDICDEKKTANAILKIGPEIIFHMAAQALVRASYKQPSYTFATNAIGTAHVLESVRIVPSVKVAVMTTTDKVYENHEWPYPYREIDALGGDDPYSASKACAEIIINAYRKSFLNSQNKSVSSARAGNVIGGGDWSEDRIVPDAMRSFISNKELFLRKPEAIRPWQHVLDALSGYLILAEAQWSDPGRFSRAWNFSPDIRCEWTVGKLASHLADLWGNGADVTFSHNPDDPHEAGLLRLDSSMARMYLDWETQWSLSESLKRTVDWYKAWQDHEDMQKYSLNQIRDYVSLRERNSKPHLEEELSRISHLKMTQDNDERERKRWEKYL